jgi:hypothetical protein
MMDGDDLNKWFEEYHAKNPHVFMAFCKMAYEVRAEGHKRYGAKTIMERLRWESAVRHPGEVYKLSNDIKDRCSARYARKLIGLDPGFEGFFRLRKTLNAFKRLRLSEAHTEQIRKSRRVL